jgi:hypothetical protein
MLVIISDLHLTDGTSGATIQAGAFNIFADRLRELAFSASWRGDGCYRPLEQIDLVLLGDGLDVIRSSRWLAEPTRPWHNAQSAEMVDVVARITNSILDQNRPALQVLRSLSRNSGIRVPPASSRGPAFDAETIPVAVRIHYMVGNHDWFFHLPGPAFDSIRRQVVENMGLANPFNAPFPHEPIENAALAETLRAHRVFARHGDIYDPFNFEGDRDASSLGDAIVIELLNRFAVEVQSQLGEELPDTTLAGLREIDNVRPLLLVPVWIDGLLERTCPFPALKKQVKRIWDEMADRFLELDFVRSHDSWGAVDIVDGLERALKFSQRLSIGWASAITAWLNEVRGPGEGSYYQHALTEQQFRNRRASHIVYGHTHHVENVPLDASYGDGQALNQIYFNSGTWRRVHSQTRLVASEHEFIPHDVMTYLAFYRGDERGGRSYETWSGTLGMGASQAPIYRIDSPSGSSEHGEAVPTPGLRGHAPHFAVSSRQAGVVPRRRVR